MALTRRARSGASGSAVGCGLASGDGWTVDDVICTSGPTDRPFEEQHSRVSIAVVVAGSFQYRSTSGSALLSPGSILLGSAGQTFECGHEHAAGDRCVAFNYVPEYFERLAVDAGAGEAAIRFRTPSLPALRDASSMVVRACSALGSLEEDDVSWEELALRVGATVARLAAGHERVTDATAPRALARVTEVVRAIERSPAESLTVNALALRAGLSPYHFLRTFERVTGLTPHQHIRRRRLREAAARLITEQTKVIDVAYECGFRDLANFNRAFRMEFGMSPRLYRRGLTVHG